MQIRLSCAMGCFFRCFRFRDDTHPTPHLITKSITSRNRDPLVTKNKLATLFRCEEEGHTYEHVAHLSLQENFDRESADEELSREETSQGPSNFHFDASCKNLGNKQPGQRSDKPAEVHSDSHCQDKISGSCHPEEHRTGRKIVRFEEVKHVSSNASAADSVGCDGSPQIKKQIEAVDSEDSPYPTPVNLTEEVPISGTVYPLNHQTGNNTRIRTHNVNPLLNPVENSTEWMALRERNSQLAQSNDQFDKYTGNSAQDLDKIQKMSLNMVPAESSISGMSQKHETIFEEDVNFNQDSPKLLVSSLSQWLKPPSTKDDRWNTKDVSGKRSHSKKSTATDRPIIGSMAAYWNDVEPSRISSRCFDGKGIPNSTNKYKEDQEVSWHATPFEERLEKALSDEKLCPQRMLDGSTMKLELEDEDEESDTAAF